MSEHFADRLVLRLRELGHPLCLGLDPHLERVPPVFRRGAMDPRAEATVDAVEDFLGAVLDRIGDRVAIVKPQAAFFERFGWRGMRLLERIVDRAHDRGLLVLLDAKRGDIGSTAAAYAAAYLRGDAIRADALTVNPYLGLDSLEPFLAAADGGRGLFVLVKTSNAGSADIQGRRLQDGATVYEEVASLVAERAAALAGPETGFSALGVVVGATWPSEAERIRELLPRSLFLVPGYGAQGGSAADAVHGFVRGPGGRLEGGIVNSSRGLLFPTGSVTEDAKTWERAIDEACNRAVDELSRAVESPEST